MKASARAFPIQGLVKYHGLRDPVRRIPFHNSISLCTGPISTFTTVEPAADVAASVDGVPVQGRGLERICAVMDAIREAAGSEEGFRVESRNDFPQQVGLGSSASGFAALAVAGAAAFGLNESPAFLSQVARIGAGSASRAVTGGVSEWKVEGEKSWSECLATPAQLGDWKVVVPLVQHPVYTENVHAEVVESPLFEGRLSYMDGALAKARTAVQSGDLEALWAIAEMDTLNLHAVTMTGSRAHITWKPATVEVMHRVRGLRDAGTPAYFSIDTGATAYINTHAGAVDDVVSAMSDVDGVAEVLVLEPGPAAALESAHLF
ncbi:MAG: diphosphomevalonate/mevalonate 3,5-bisphosphate decarboxylase family protein [Thermoplasmatota archaeon]